VRDMYRCFSTYYDDNAAGRSGVGISTRKLEKYARVNGKI